MRSKTPSVQGLAFSLAQRLHADLLQVEPNGTSGLDGRSRCDGLIPAVQIWIIFETLPPQRLYPRPDRDVGGRGILARTSQDI
jgi:hypothetical protein